MGRLFCAGIAKAQELKAKSDSTDKAIDQMVYALYGLTEAEIKIVAGWHTGGIKRL